MPPSSHYDRLMDLLIRWEECRRLGQDLSATELSPDDPGLAEDLAKRIGQLRALEEPLRIACDASPLSHAPAASDRERPSGRESDPLADSGVALPPPSTSRPRRTGRGVRRRR